MPLTNENFDTLTRIYRGWEQGDFAVSISLFDQNAVLVIDSEIPDGGVFLGMEGIRSYMTRFLEPWKSLTITAESFREVGDSVLVKVSQTGVGRDSGVPVSLDYFHLWTFRGASVIRLDSIVSEARALEAAGLSRRAKPR